MKAWNEQSSRSKETHEASHRRRRRAGSRRVSDHGELRPQQDPPPADPGRHPAPGARGRGAAELQPVGSRTRPGPRPQRRHPLRLPGRGDSRGLGPAGAQPAVAALRRRGLHPPGAHGAFRTRADRRRLAFDRSGGGPVHHGRAGPGASDACRRRVTGAARVRRRRRRPGDRDGQRGRGHHPAAADPPRRRSRAHRVRLPRIRTPDDHGRPTAAPAPSDGFARHRAALAPRVPRGSRGRGRPAAGPRRRGLHRGLRGQRPRRGNRAGRCPAGRDRGAGRGRGHRGRRPAAVRGDRAGR